MHRLFRHFFAAFFCIALFSVTGTLGSLANFFLTHPPDSTATIAMSWFMNFIVVSTLTLMVLMPVTSIADHLFKYRWALSTFWQIPAVIPVFVIYVGAWSLIFGSHFLLAAYTATMALIFPMLLYWCIFRVTDLDL